MPKGWLSSGSPDCNIDRTFTYQFCFQTVVKKSPTINKLEQIGDPMDKKVISERQLRTNKF